MLLIFTYPNKADIWIVSVLSDVTSEIEISLVFMFIHLLLFIYLLTILNSFIVTDSGKQQLNNNDIIHSYYPLVKTSNCFCLWKIMMAISYKYFNQHLNKRNFTAVKVWNSSRILWHCHKVVLKASYCLYAFEKNCAEKSF